MNSYMRQTTDLYEFEKADLPSSERLTDEWVADVDWIFRNSEPHVVACVVTGIRYTGDGFRACPETIQEMAKATAERLFLRYCERCVRQ